MLRLCLAVYTALVLGANVAIAQTATAPAAADLRSGDMRKLVLHDAPRPFPTGTMIDGQDAPHDLADWQGRWVVLNFWATWCAPCRQEMPSLAALQSAMPDLAVLPVATGRNAVPAIRKFYAEAGVQALPVLRDPKSELARAAAVMGLPVTVILNPQGQEVGRLIGDADWNGPAARAVLGALMAGG